MSAIQDHSDDSDNADPDETFILEIASLSNGRDGVGRHEGKVVFVPGVAPGDRVRARITESHASYARAAVVEILDAGAARRTPPCPWVDTCGGCAWQQVSYAAQLEAKAQNVRDALTRIGGVQAARELAIVPAPDEWSYRRRIRLHVDAGRLGYRAARSRRLVEIDTCGVADPVIAALVAPVRVMIPHLRTRLVSAELIANGVDAAAVLLLTTRDALRPRDSVTLRAFVTEHAAVAGIRLRGHGWQRSFGDVRVAVYPEAGAPPIVQTAGAFSQVNEGANQRLVSAVVAMAGPATTAVDLFCGTGNLTLPLARAGLRVQGFDNDRTAIAAARASATHADLGKRARFAVHDAIDALGKVEGSPELVVLDPPRGGAPDVARKLGRMRPPRILYVSCDPATLARDAKTLAAAGYRIDRVQPIDLFPQTEHIETVLEAVLTGL